MATYGRIKYRLDPGANQIALEAELLPEAAHSVLDLSGTCELATTKLTHTRSDSSDSGGWDHARSPTLC